jgi:hypothetical protein
MDEYGNVSIPVTLDTYAYLRQAITIAAHCGENRQTGWATTENTVITSRGRNHPLIALYDYPVIFRILAISRVSFWVTCGCMVNQSCSLKAYFCFQSAIAEWREPKAQIGRQNELIWITALWWPVQC